MRKQQKCKPLVERFWEKVDKSDDCWVWTANCTKGRNGEKRYGLISAGRRGEGMLYAHRVSWELHFGQIPESLRVLHRCDNPQCVRPDHLFVGTQADNMADMVEKGRRERFGPAPGVGAKSKLTRRQLVGLRRDAETHNHKEVATKYGVCKSTVRNIVLGLTNQYR